MKHRFFPFIHYTIVEKRSRRGRNEKGDRNEFREVKKKKREIFYANHFDSQVFAYYGELIKKKLEFIYSTDDDLNQSVIAYRAIKFNSQRNKCNIDFAWEVFKFIRDSKSLELVVLCFDIKSFFDSIDHKLLKKFWAKLFGGVNLPPDHYQVFKAITKFTYVEVGDLIKEFNEHKVKRLQYLKNKEVISFCRNDNEFRTRVVRKGMIRRNPFSEKVGESAEKGIPQGSPISAILSNLFMLDLDKKVIQFVSESGGMYRRYSDDILLVVPKGFERTATDFVMESCKELKLIIQEEKTQEVHFHRNSVQDSWQVFTIENSLRVEGRPLSYLGFEYDGRLVRLRQRGLSAYYRSLKRQIRRKAFYAKCADIKNKRSLKKQDSWIYRQQIYQSKSHLGASNKRRKINGKVKWGNYISYVRNASKVMMQPSIARQIRNHWKVIESQIKKYEVDYELPRSPARRGRKLKDV